MPAGLFRERWRLWQEYSGTPHVESPERCLRLLPKHFLPALSRVSVSRLQGLRGCGTDCADSASNRSGITITCAQSCEEVLDCIHACEHDPVVCFELFYARIQFGVVRQRRQFDYRQFDWFGAEFVQLFREIGSLSGSARDNDSLTSQREFVEPGKSFAQATTSPMTTVTGGCRCAFRGFAASVASVPVTTVCSGRVPHRTAMAGVSGDRPAAIIFCAMSRKMLQAHEDDDRAGQRMCGSSRYPQFVPGDEVTTDV